jgi:long-chain fatty acid transport protein
MDNTWHLEVDATYIYLSEIDYEDARNPAFNSSSEAEHFFVPTGFAVSPSFGGFRFGLAVVAPYGLSKQWEDSYAKAVAEEFSLTVIEVNPTVSYKIGDMFSVAAGPRMLYADATVKSDASGLGVPLSREMEGDTVEWGWNVAVAAQPIEPLNISATYRSHVDLDFEDTAKLNLMGTRMTLDTDVSVPAPAVFTFAVAYDVLASLNVELAWDRTFWSEYDNLDFNFSPAVPGNPFEPPVNKDWDDSDAFRLGLTYKLNDALTLMGGFAFDNNPVPTKTISFELPDSDAFLYSLGAQYKINENMEVGLGFLYDYKKTRTVKVTPTDRVYGEFTNASAILITAGFNYKF